MKNNHFELLDSKLTELLGSLAPLFSSLERSSVQHFIDVGEYGLALETLCAIITEAHKVIDARVKEQVRQLRDLMELDSPMVDAVLDTPTDDV